MKMKFFISAILIFYSIRPLFSVDFLAPVSKFQTRQLTFSGPDYELDFNQMKFLARGTDSTVYGSDNVVYKLYTEQPMGKMQEYRKIFDMIKVLLEEHNPGYKMKLNGEDYDVTFSVNEIQELFLYRNSYVVTKSRYVSFPALKSLQTDNITLLITIKSFLLAVTAHVCNQLKISGIDLATMANVMFDIDSDTKKITLILTDICPVIDYLSVQTPDFLKISPGDLNDAMHASA